MQMAFLGVGSGFGETVVGESSPANAESPVARVNKHLGQKPSGIEIGEPQSWHSFIVFMLTIAMSATDYTGIGAGR